MKKKIRYADMKPVPGSVAPDAGVDASSAAAPAVSPGAEATAEVPTPAPTSRPTTKGKVRTKASSVPEPVPVAASAAEPPKPAAKAPLDLARALAAARAKEQAVDVAPEAAAPAAAPAATSSVGRKTPAASAPTPGLSLRGATPISGMPVIPARPARLTTTIGPGRSMRDRARSRVGKADILVFRVGTERFGVDLSAVEEAVDLPVVQFVPEMPPAMLGVSTVRGGLTAVYSPHAALGLPRTKPASALIFRRGRWRLAIVVDDVDDVTTIDLADLRDSHEFDVGDGLVLGVARHLGALLALLDADALLAACQAVPILETA